MPRDFVPCLYDERELHDEVTQTFSRRYEVVEAFSLMEVSTHEPLCLVSLESHAFHVGTAESAVERLLWPTLAQRVAFQVRQAQQCREQLFATFYAAMADLE